jgi:hypothetical protein
LRRNGTQPVALAVDELRELCIAKRTRKNFSSVRAYDSGQREYFLTSSFFNEYGIPLTDVTNALAWARREFRKIALERLRELCGSEEEFHREARAAFGWDPK